MEAADPKQKRKWTWRGQNGCDQSRPVALYYFEGRPLYRCPAKLTQPWTWSLIALWRSCRDMHTTPFAGGVLDQPAILLDAFEAIGQVVNDTPADSGKTSGGGSVQGPPGRESLRAKAPVRPSAGPLAARRRR